MGVVGVVAVAYLLNFWLSSDPTIDAVFIMQPLSEFSDCIEGNMMFERNVYVDMWVKIVSDTAIVRNQISVRIDTDWGVHNDQVTPLLWVTLHTADFGVRWNVDRVVVPHKLYHCKICGLSQAGHNGRTRLIPSSKHAKIIFQ